MISPSTVTRSGKERKVKNLGWLLRNWKNIVRIHVSTGKLLNASDDAYMWVEMRDGSTYETGWADRGVCWDWLDRPVLRGAPLDWHREDGTIFTTCGDDKPAAL
jgi:hypothetical protein